MIKNDILKLDYLINFVINVLIFDMYYCYFCLCQIWSRMRPEVILHAIIFLYLLSLESLG